MWSEVKTGMMMHFDQDDTVFVGTYKDGVRTGALFTNELVGVPCAWYVQIGGVGRTCVPDPYY